MVDHGQLWSVSSGIEHDHNDYISFHFMVDEPVKTIIDHGLTMVDHGQKTNSTIIDHELTMTNRQWLTMVSQ